jgi:hypothetical protein
VVSHIHRTLLISRSLTIITAAKPSVALITIYIVWFRERKSAAQSAEHILVSRIQSTTTPANAQFSAFIPAHAVTLYYLGLADVSATLMT